MRAVPGEVVYRSPELFSGKLMFVKRGFIVKAMMSPLHEDPLLVSLSGPGALCGAYEDLYVKDRMPRRHWCATSAELLCVHSELLLRICDQNPEWQKELRGYAASCAVSDRLAMVINQTAGLEERSAVFVLLVGLSTESGFLDSIDNPGVEWLSIPALPSRTSSALRANSWGWCCGASSRRTPSVCARAAGGSKSPPSCPIGNGFAP